MRKILCLLVLFGAFTASAQRFVRYFDTVTDMAASNPADPNVYVVVGGSVSFNDNQAARWKWVSGSVDPADGNTVVSTWAGGWPGKPAGRWKKINEASGIVIDTSGFITNYNVVVVNDKASLQNINVTNNIAVALVKGKYGMNDGWEGQFTFNAASTAVADDAFYVAPNTGVGMWERQTPNPLREIPATWFDPNLTNGVIQAAINYAASLSTNAVPGREVLLPPKFIEINGNTGLNMSNNVTLVGQNGTVLATSAGTVAGYQMIKADHVTNWGVKNLQLVGLASVTGYGIVVSNSNRGVWGGISFATNFTGAPVWITNSSEIVPFDDKWVKNSVRAYGAQGNNLNNDTEAFNTAIHNMGGQTGDRIIVPPGSYAINLWITQAAGLVMEALNQGGQGLTNFILTPFTPTLPVIRMGTNTQTGGYPIRSTTFRGLMFDGRGPSFVLANNATWGVIGLSIQGGTESAYFDNCEWQAFTGQAIQIIGSSTDGSGVENITFNNPNIQVSTDTATNTTVGLYARYRWSSASLGSDVTKVTILSGKMNGSTNGYIMGLEGVEVDMVGVYLDGYGGHFLYMDTQTNTVVPPPLPVYYPHVWGTHVTMDKHPGGVGNVVVEDRYTGSFPWSVSGTTQTSGTFLWNGKEYANYDFKTRGFANMIYGLTVIGALKFSVPGDYYEGPNTLANDSATNLLFTTLNNLIVATGDGNFLQVEANTNAIISLREMVTDYDVMTVVITNLPTGGLDTFVVNGQTLSWVNVVTDPTNEVAIGVSTDGCAVNLYNHLAVYPYTNFLAGIGLDSSTVTLTSGVGSGLTNTSTVGWASITNENRNQYGQSTWIQHAGLSRIIPGGEFRIDNPSATRVFSISSNAVGDAVHINNTGIGVFNSAPTAPLSLGFNGTLTTSREGSIGYRTTNYSGSHAALSVELEANPDTSGAGSSNVTANYFGIYSVARTTRANTNNFYNPASPYSSLSLGNRFETRHEATNGIGVVAAIIAGPNSTNAGAGWITNSIGLQLLDQTYGETNWAILAGRGRVQLGVDSLEFSRTQPLTLAAVDTITPSAVIIDVQGNGGPVVMSSTPTIANGREGQVIILTGVSANTVELVDRGTMAGSGIFMGGGETNRVLSAGESIMLKWSQTLGYWSHVR